MDPSAALKRFISHSKSASALTVLYNFDLKAICLLSQGKTFSVLCSHCSGGGGAMVRELGYSPTRSLDRISLDAACDNGPYSISINILTAKRPP
jgi:hypothetical protein